MPNHLVSEKSPYLQQHVHNPVDWHPWGEAAFQKARKEDKPIFLSIGYSTCHWCHVMERESFENDSIADLLNRDFVSIKVDREERPDVDRIYMAFVQATTGSGGWPMSVFLTPSLEPFFGGTYFPPDNRYGRPGFPLLLERIAQAWKSDRERINTSGSQVVQQMRGMGQEGASASESLDKGVLDSCYHYFRRTFDAANGGFGESPKFPRPSVLNFLFRYHAMTKNPEPLDMALDTLRKMAEGGMNDQLGGGFHRYSVDERWFVPHFEKMLYDQAQLAVSYLEACQLTQDPFFARVARETLDYVLRDLTSPEGGFYSAEDADSIIDPAHPKEKGEGAFYIWDAKEIESLLSPLAAKLVSYIYGVEPEGNVENDPHQEFGGRNILYVRHSIEDAIREFEMAAEVLESQLARASARLLEARGQRPRPHLDDKILTSWNGLMISAFAKAAQVLDEPRYLAAAQRSAAFVLEKLYNRATGLLLRRYRDGEAAVNGFLDDYAFFIAALLDLYEADFDTAHLDMAIALAAKMRELFEDRENGAFFTTAGEDENLVVRMKDDYDGAEPSGNSIALMDLLRLANFTDDDDLRRAADRTLRALSRRIAPQPPAVPQMLVAFQYSLAPKRQVILLGLPEAELTQRFLRELRSHFVPNSITLLAGSPQQQAKLAERLPVIADMALLGGQTTAYVCQDYACQLPTNEVSRFTELLQ